MGSSEISDRAEVRAHLGRRWRPLPRRGGRAPALGRGRGRGPGLLGGARRRGVRVQLVTETAALALAAAIR